MNATTEKQTHRPATVVALLLALFMAAMETTVVATAMPTVVGELGGALRYGWVFTVYMLTSTVTVPIYGKLADLYGRKPVMLVAMAIFLFGSMASGQAKTMSQLIVFRGLQGVGAGGMQPIAVTIVGDIFSIEERGKMQGIFGAVWGIAGLVGPLLGGIIVASLSWRWVFYVNVPFGILSATVLVFSLVENVAPKKHGLDVAGAALLSAAVIALLLGIDGRAPWLLLPASLALTAAFLVVESRSKEPLLPLALFAQRVLATSSVLSALFGGAMVGLITFVPLYAQGVLGSTPTAAGAAIASIAVTWPIASTLAGRLIPKIGFRPLVRAGFVLVALSSIGLTLAMSNAASIGTIRIGSAFFGLGLGLANTPLLIAVQASVGFSQRGVATSSTMFFRNIGGTVAVGVMGVVLARTLLAHGDGAESAALVARILGPERRTVPASALASLSGELALGLSRIMWVVTALAIGGALAAWLFPRVDALEVANQTPASNTIPNR